jgi:hypothetical protein
MAGLAVAVVIMIVAYGWIKVRRQRKASAQQ